MNAIDQSANARTIDYAAISSLVENDASHRIDVLSVCNVGLEARPFCMFKEGKVPDVLEPDGVNICTHDLSILRLLLRIIPHVSTLNLLQHIHGYRNLIFALGSGNFGH